MSDSCQLCYPEKDTMVMVVCYSLTYSQFIPWDPHVLSWMAQPDGGHQNGLEESGFVHPGGEKVKGELIAP